jgi:hypothetical protein
LGKEATQYKKGEGGRPKGIQNKITRTVKETVLSVFNEIQSDPKVKLSAFAKQYPRDFYAIAAKLIPTEVQATVEATINWEETKTYEAEQKAD